MTTAVLCLESPLQLFLAFFMEYPLPDPCFACLVVHYTQQLHFFQDEH